MLSRLITGCVVITILLGCSGENPFVTREVIEELRKKSNPDITHVVCLFENDVYYFDNLLQDPQRLTNTPSVVKTDIKLSYDHSKMAYLVNKSPVIIDHAGDILHTLTQFVNVKQMGWSPDSETLWMLIGNAVQFFGPPMDIPAVTFPTGVSGAQESRILSLSISPTGEIAYVWRYFTNQYRHTLVHKTPDGDVTQEDFTVHDQLIYVDFSAEGDVTYGFHPNENARVFEKLEFLDKNGDAPVISQVSFAIFSSPIVRPDIGYILCGRREDFAQRFELVAYSLTNSDNNKSRTDFYNTNGLFIDWK